MELRQFIGIIRRRWALVLTIFLIAIAAATAVSATITPKYSSSVRLFMSVQTSTTIDAYSGGIYSAQRVASYTDLATDPVVLQKVIDQVGLDITPEALASEVKASAVPNSVILEIVVSATSPDLAQQIANAEADQISAIVDRLEKPVDSTDPAVIVARVVGSASINQSPVSPNTLLNVAAGGLLGLLVGIGASVLREMFDTSVKSRVDLEEITKSTLLATIPFDGTLEDHPLVSDADGRVDRSEAFRVLRTNLQFVELDGARTTLVSSALPEEGKTTTATNLAIVMAQSGRSVLLMDCDLRNPSAAKLLSLENSVGVLSILLNKARFEDCVQTHKSGIDFLGTGPQPPNPAEILETTVMRDLLSYVTDRYDAIIIDAPPLLPVADSSILASRVDGVLLVTRFGKTSRDQLSLATARINGVNGRIFGSVLNRVPIGRGSEYGYGYGYGYGGRLGEAGDSTPGQKGRFGFGRRKPGARANRALSRH